jgi:hypothetical protein
VQSIFILYDEYMAVGRSNGEYQFYNTREKLEESESPFFTLTNKPFAEDQYYAGNTSLFDPTII